MDLTYIVTLLIGLLVGIIVTPIYQLFKLLIERLQRQESTGRHEIVTPQPTIEMAEQALGNLDILLDNSRRTYEKTKSVNGRAKKALASYQHSVD